MTIFADHYLLKNTGEPTPFLPGKAPPMIPLPVSIREVVMNSSSFSAQVVTKNLLLAGRYPLMTSS